MKKHVLAGAVALACSAGAMAQVKISGFLETQVGRTPGDATTKVFEEGGSRVKFTGDEDLGGGLKASFYLEHRLDTSNGDASAPFWKGGSWVGLSSDAAGSVKIGRWWSQAFLKAQYAADAFGMLTMGLGTWGTAGTGGAFWVDNSVTYENSVGGFSFGAQYAPERPTGAAKHPWTAGVSYAADALYVGLGYEASTDGSADEKQFTVGANYDLGVVKLFAGYADHTSATLVKTKDYEFGFSAPVGPGAFIGSYNTRKNTTASVTTEQLLSLGYKYNLSKSTFVDVVVSNDSKKTTSKSGYSLGVFHSF